MEKGNVLLKRDDKLLVLSRNRYYIVKGEGQMGSDVEFNEKDALPMPSYLFAIAAMEEENLDDTLNFIHEQWFANKK